jgi:hypothetical protein
MPARLNRPTEATLTGRELLDVLASFYESIVELRRTTTETVVALSTHADMRRTPGNVGGPRVCIVTGRTSVLDGGEGAYAWDPTSKATDNDTSVIGGGLTVGRWRKVAL